MRKNGLRLEEREIRIMARMAVRTSSVVTHFVRSGDPNLKAHQKNKGDTHKKRIQILCLYIEDFEKRQFHLQKARQKRLVFSQNAAAMKNILKMTSNRKETSGIHWIDTPHNEDWESENDPISDWFW